MLKIAEIEADVDLITAELLLDQPRQQGDHHTDVDEQGQRCRCDQHEWAGEHPRR